LPAYTNHGPATWPSLWMPLPLRASPYKGEESEGCPHKSLKSHINIQDKSREIMNASLTGETVSEQEIEGEDSVNTVGCN